MYNSSKRSVFSDVNWVFVAIFSLIFIYAVWQVRTILMLGLASTALVVLFTFPISALMTRFGLGRGVSILLTLIGFLLILIFLVMLVFPTLFAQFARLTTVTIPEGIEQLIQWWNSGSAYEQFPFLSSLENVRITDDVINEIVLQVTNALGQLGGSVVPFVGDVANTLLSVLIVFFLSMYLVAEPQRYLQGFVRLAPLWYRDRLAEILERINSALKAWLQLTGVSMLVTGVGTGLGLALLGINEWAALGVLTGTLSFIPNFGPVIALVPALAVGIVQVPSSLGWIILIVYGVSFIQSQVVSPILANENMSLPPIAILGGQIIFGIFFGFMGLMFAVPMTAMARILVDEIYVKDILGDRPTVVHDDDEGELLPDGS